MQLFEEILKAEEEKYLITNTIKIPLKVSGVIPMNQGNWSLINFSDNVFTEEGFCTFCPEPQPERPLNFN